MSQGMSDEGIERYKAHSERRTVMRIIVILNGKLLWRARYSSLFETGFGASATGREQRPATGMTKSCTQRVMQIRINIIYIRGRFLLIATCKGDSLVDYLGPGCAAAPCQTYGCGKRHGYFV